ncbi:hypothetical protein RV040_004883 [Vibrio alginolyticus]|uniref:hypothetical protein n=1 Tax=Vibrio alginolyticus TaxID=663 RepID=UPI000310E435|nr:hypothetical protein [Vibrio alginolyticus]EKA2634993.1 hypothetical protein [Vibrio alginolyticus]ELA9732684.1 hypothetical protein [Vibrio alginolyticus]ELB2904152.1 hypothetical protein [Vibrio alginolyticus]ELK8501301.1 hypothetical protein [Vibrio alginolyticus]
MSMFDIEDSKNVELEGNKTNREKLAKVKNVEGFKAKNNEAHVPSDKVEPEEDIVDIKPNFMGIGLNLNALVRRLFRKRT